MKISRQNNQISTYIWSTKIDTRGYKHLNRQKKSHMINGKNK